MIHSEYAISCEIIQNEIIVGPVIKFFCECMVLEWNTNPVVRGVQQLAAARACLYLRSLCPRSPGRLSSLSCSKTKGLPRYLSPVGAEGTPLMNIAHDP